MKRRIKRLAGISLPSCSLSTFGVSAIVSQTSEATFVSFHYRDTWRQVQLTVTGTTHGLDAYDRNVSVPESSSQHIEVSYEGCWARWSQRLDRSLSSPDRHDLPVGAKICFMWQLSRSADYCRLRLRLTCLTSISVNPARDHKQCAIVPVQDGCQHDLGGVA